MKYDYQSSPNNEWKTVYITPEVIQHMLNGDKIKAVRALRDVVQEYQSEDGSWRPNMGLKDAKECVEHWESLIWPGVEVTCPQCQGKGVIVTRNSESPMCYKGIGLVR
jgi:hypothetical protein